MALVSQPAQLLPLVGREAELSRIDSSLRQISPESGAQLLTLVGPTGVGKSRLVREWVARLSKEKPEEIRIYAATPPSKAQSYGLLARLLQERFALGDGKPKSAWGTTVRSELQAVLDDRRVGDVAFLLGELLGIPFEPS